MSQSKKQATQSGFRIIVIDDEVDMLTNYRRLLERAGYECRAISTAAHLEKILEEFRPHLVLTDLVMPERTGIEVLDVVRAFNPKIPVVVITAQGTIESAIEAMKRKATDYLTKPISFEQLLSKIQSIINTQMFDDDTPPEHDGSDRHKKISEKVIGVSPPFKKVLKLARKVSQTDVNVLVVGKSGTGKEVIARAIHDLSPRRDEIFVPVDCASLPENLLESELFGYRKGSFTGATSNKMGLFEFAHKGTLFLDEIGELPLALQAKLLRVLQERSFRPIGGREQIDVDIRIVAATNRDLGKALAEKTFRSDLYYRLNVVTIELPCLKDRVEDIPLLANHLLDLFLKNNNVRKVGIAPTAMDCMRRYAWPGNVRELQNVIEHAATMAEGQEIRVEDLPATLCQGEAPEAQDHEGNGLFARKDEVVEHFERDYLISLLVEHRFNISRAAQSAGCNRRTLYRMIHRYGLDLEVLRQQQGAGAQQKS